MRAILLIIAAVAVLAAADPPTVAQAWARATAPSAQAAGLFCTIIGGSADDVLASATCEVAAAVELHTVITDPDHGVRRMQRIERIDVPAGGSVILRPGSLHIMLLGLKRPLSRGERVPFTLRFQAGGEVTAVAEVGAAGAMSAPATAAPAP